VDTGLIVLDSNLFLDKPKDKLHNTSVFSITKSSNGDPVAVFNIHTSCSQPLFIDQVFFDGDTSLTVVSAFDKDGNPSLPSSTCEVAMDHDLGFGGGIVLEGFLILPDGYTANDEEHILLPIGPEHPENNVDNANRITLAVCEEIPPDCDCDRPTKFTVEYDGPEDVKIEVYKKNDVGDTSKRLALFDPVMDGDQITINSLTFPTPKSTVEADTVYRITGATVSEDIKIHTSCSKGLFIGDIHEGPDTANGVSLIVVSGTDANNIPTVPLAVCKMEDDVKCKGIESMTVFYSPKILNEAVWIEVEDGKINDVINMNTEDDPTLVINASNDKFPKELKFKIYNINPDDTRGSLIKEIKIHTSCSKPINVGDIFTNKDAPGMLTITALVKIF